MNTESKIFYFEFTGRTFKGYQADGAHVTLAVDGNRAKDIDPSAPCLDLRSIPGRYCKILWNLPFCSDTVGATHPNTLEKYGAVPTSEWLDMWRAAGASVVTVGDIIEEFTYN